MADVDNILPDNDELDEQLLNYLNGNLSGEEKHAVELQMQNDEFMKDAVEGLQQFSSNKKLDQYVHSLNQNLRQQLAIKKQKKWKRSLRHPSWIVVATVIILLLCLMAYGVIVFVEKH